MSENPLASRLRGFGTTVFTEMTRLAQETGAVNLGQGFPDFDGPDFVKRAAIEAIGAGHNQYCRMGGLPDLARAVAEHQTRFYRIDFDPETEISVYSGATEALAVSFQALLEPGDEVILLEPYYDSYPAAVALAGGLARVVTLEAPGFRWAPGALEAAVTPRTRAILLNSPHNPTGRVLTDPELEEVAELCRRRDLVAVADEVYEHIVFEGHHRPLAALPGMRERTITISSTGKTFSLTGWKIGYSCASPDLTRALRTVHQFVTFCTATPLQHAMSAALRAGDAYFTDLAAGYRRRRDKLCGGLAEVGFDVLTPAGTYFVLADIRPLGWDDDVAFCRMLPGRVGVAAIPPTAFYQNKAEGRHLVRFAFCKTDAVLDEAIRRLERLRPARS